VRRLALRVSDHCKPGPLELVSGTVFGNGTAGLIYRRLR